MPESFAKERLLVRMENASTPATPDPKIAFPIAPQTQDVVHATAVEAHVMGHARAAAYVKHLVLIISAYLLLAFPLVLLLLPLRVELKKMVAKGYALDAVQMI